MAFGIDTLRNRLDLIPGNALDSFKELNGGIVAEGGVVGGDPDFAGRNFLGGDFLWGHAEATNALGVDSNTDEDNGHANPEHPELLSLSTPFIAPMQAPHQPSRQQVSGVRGHVYGRIDAYAICNRLGASISALEFDLPHSNLVYVWLIVDPTMPFSVDYWAGWSDQVNNFAFFTMSGGGPGALQPFRSCIFCSFSAGTNGKLQPEPHVIPALVGSWANYKGSKTTCYALWADVPGNVPLNWSAFDGVTEPLLWRFSQGFRDSTGVVVNDTFNMDAANPIPGGQKASDFMLVTKKWQPSVPTITNYGFIVNQQNPGITQAQIQNIKANPLPQLTDLGAHYTIPSALPSVAVSVIGRYLKPDAVGPGGVPPKGSFVMNRDEAILLSKAKFQVFSIWENPNVHAKREPTSAPYFDPAFQTGTDDGQDAFKYCGEVLRQPPQTPIFFCVDFDAADPTGTGLTQPQLRKRIKDYFTLVKQARDAYAQGNPDRYYLIGVYGNGRVNRWCYEQGFVSFFWQSTGPGSTGNTLPGEFNWAPNVPLRPWYHANRWQFNREASLIAKGWTYTPGQKTGADPDVDWGDGGTWNLSNSLVQDFEAVVQALKGLAAGATFNMWGNLVLPPLP